MTIDLESRSSLRVPGISVAVAARGRVKDAQGYGLLAADGADRVGTESVFHAASMSKMVTALAVLSLVSQGRLSLDEDINGRLR